MKELAIFIAEKYGTTLNDMQGNNRHANISLARQCFAYYMMNNKQAFGNVTVKKVGEFLNRDHSTVVYAYYKFKDMIDIKYAPAVNVYESLSNYFPSVVVKRQ